MTKIVTRVEKCAVWHSRGNRPSDFRRSEDKVFVGMLKGFGAALLGPEDGAGRSDIGKGLVEEIPEGWR